MIIVTGGAGFIGSVLVKELNMLGREDIIIVDRLKNSSKWKNIRGLKFFDYIQADELFESVFDEFVDNIDYIFHMGACSSTTELDMDYLMENNLNYSKNLFLLASQNNIPFIYASSAATYGDGELGYEDDESQLGQYIPLNPYGYSKQLFDEWVIKQSVRPDFWFGLKFFNVYGPNEYHKGNMSSIVFKAFEQINKTGVVKLFKSYKDGFEDGKQLRDFIYVKDVAKGILALMETSDTSKSGIYNMGTGLERSFKDLVLATFKAMNIKPHINYIEMPIELRGQYQYFTKASMEKFSKVTNDPQFLGLEAGVKDYVQNYLMKDNPYY